MDNSSNQGMDNTTDNVTDNAAFSNPIIDMMRANYPFEIIDIHAHFPIENTTGLPVMERHPKLKDYGATRGGRMRKEWGNAAYEAPAKVGDEDTIWAYAERWAQDLRDKGISRINFLTANSNERLAEIVAKYPEQFTGFAHHALEPGADVKLKHAVNELGLRGYKLFGPRTEIPFEDPSVRGVWEFCAERELPVLIHFGYLGRGGGVVSHPRMSPLSLFEVARDFPEIPFIIPHFGAGYWQDLLALCWSLPNIYVDSSGSNQWVRWMPYELTLEQLFAKAYETFGPERMLFGTDSNAFPRGFAVRYLQDQLRICYQRNFPESDIALFFGGNAKRLLKLE
jgi:predicted TIM-barrel fold metal-dependent hydrolase